MLQGDGLLPKDHQLTVAIQAGGESKRMGRSKATVPFLGRPLLMRLVERVDVIATQILITTNEPQNLTFLEQMPQYPKIKLCTDVLPYRGSLAGLLTALTHANNDLMAVCACDMYNVNSRLFAKEYEIAAEGGYDIVVPVSKQGFEPFHALYRTSACLPVAKDTLDRGLRSMKDLILSPNLKTYQMSMEEVFAILPKDGCFANCNTPSELAHAEEHVREEAGSEHIPNGDVQ